MHCASRAARVKEGAAAAVREEEEEGEEEEAEEEVCSLKSISSGAWSEYLASPMGSAAALMFALRAAT